MKPPEEIAKKNDAIRDRLPMVPSPHRAVLTAIVSCLTIEVRMRLLDAIKNYSSFNEDVDPYGEHDFGFVTIDDEDYYWKFDYYDDKFEYGEEDGNRVLTIMHKSEY